MPNCGGWKRWWRCASIPGWPPGASAARRCRSSQPGNPTRKRSAPGPIRYPEVSRQNKRFAMLKDSGRLREGTPGAEIHARVAPEKGDIVVTKRRVGAFSTTDLEPILRANGIATLAMFGIATSGVLSTVRWAADMDYPMIVVSDACADMDSDVHRVLTEKILPTQATVVTAQEFVKAANSK